jgi:pyruvate dehydrogenase E2 component (dihydrolipoamide acetyltransferase)
MALFETHLDLHPAQPATGWRNLAIGTWRAAKDPSVYGVLELPVVKAREYLAEVAAVTGERVTITHFLGKAVAESMRRHPEVNAVLRFGRLYPRRHVTLFFQVATDLDGRDLSGVTVRDVENKSVADIAAEMNRRVQAVRAQTDRTYTQMKSLMARLPGWLTGTVLDLASLVQYGFNLWSPLLGTPKDPMGSVMITNVGSFGLEFAFAPLVAYSKVPIVITQCAIKDQVVAQDGKIEIVPMLRLCVTFDHRLIDGAHAAKLSRAMTAIFADPWRELGRPGVAATNPLAGGLA